MKLSRQTKSEEKAFVCVACGQLAEIPVQQLGDFHRGQRTVAVITCACALIVYAVLSLV
jgi:hypothetical protein